jgi:hypothetical protein
MIGIALLKKIKETDLRRICIRLSEISERETAGFMEATRVVAQRRVKGDK